jgi:hypothetical protein
MTTQPAQQQPMAPAGWYADNGVLRWWDGARWTPHVAPAGPAAPPPPTTAPWPTRSPRRRTVMGIVLGLGLGLIVAVVAAMVGYGIVGATPTQDQEAAVSGVAGLLGTVGIVVGCLYGARKR